MRTRIWASIVVVAFVVPLLAAEVEFGAITEVVTRQWSSPALDAVHEARKVLVREAGATLPLQGARCRHEFIALAERASLLRDRDGSIPSRR